MNRAIPNCLVSDYEAHISAISLPDANDRHVLAAAIEASAHLIITFNLSDFPNTLLRTFGVQSIHPDNFLSGLFDEKSGLFLSGVKEHRASLRNPPKDAAGYVRTLKATGLKELSLRVEANLSRI